MQPTNGATYVPDTGGSASSEWVESSQKPAAADFEPIVARRRAPQPDSTPGLPGWLAVVLLVAIAAVGGLIDEVNGSSIRGWFNWSLVIASLLAILAVKRTQMFGVVVAPPLVYFVASAGMLYLRSGGLKDRKVLIDAAANWLVYGFPAIAGATAVVLVVAGVRMLIRR